MRQSKTALWGCPLKLKTWSSFFSLLEGCHALTRWDFLSCDPTSAQFGLTCPFISCSTVSKCHKLKSNPPHTPTAPTHRSMVCCLWLVLMCLNNSFNQHSQVYPLRSDCNSKGQKRHLLDIQPYNYWQINFTRTEIGYFYKHLAP